MVNTIPEYTIKHINGNEYMFIQWKSGDYTIHKMNPAYYVFKKVSDDIIPDLMEDANEDDNLLTGVTHWNVLGSDGQEPEVKSSDIKVLIYEEYVAWLEEFKIEAAGKTFKLDNGNGEEVEVSSDEMIATWESISEQVKDGTKQFKQVIIDGVVVAWGDFSFIG